MKQPGELISGYDDTASLEDALRFQHPGTRIRKCWSWNCRLCSGGRGKQSGKRARWRHLELLTFTAQVGNEPVLAVHGADGSLGAFFNVCRHHAAAVAVEPCGRAQSFRCPYHGWTYGLDGRLKGAPEFNEVRNFDRTKNGLVPIRVDTWEQFVFVALDAGTQSLREFLGGFAEVVAPLNLGNLNFYTRRAYTPTAIGRCLSITILMAGITFRTS